MELLNEIFGERVISRNLRHPRSPDLTPPDFYLWGAAKSAVYRARPRTLNELKAAISVHVRNISQADLQKVFANKIKRVQACMDARGHHFQHLLKVHSGFPNTLYYVGIPCKILLALTRGHKPILNLKLCNDISQRHIRS
jgi:hypothetical protein